MRDAATPHPAVVKRELNFNGTWVQINEAVGLTYLLLILRSAITSPRQSDGATLGRRSACSRHHHVVALQGPPGTGKTTSQGVDVSFSFAIDKKYQAINGSAMNRPSQQMAQSM